MSDFEATMRGLAFLGSPSGDGVVVAVSDCGVSRDGHGHTLGESGAPRNPLSSNAEQRKRDSAALDSQLFASPAPASEDALAGTGGGEHPKGNSSPLHKFDAPSSQERGAIVPADARKSLAERDHSVRLWQVPDAVNESGRGASIQFPADDRFADNIARAIDRFLDARDVAEQERLESIEAERESLGLPSSDSATGAEMAHCQHGYGGLK